MDGSFCILRMIPAVHWPLWPFTYQKSYSLYWQTIDKALFFCYILYKLIIIE